VLLELKRQRRRKRIRIFLVIAVVLLASALLLSRSASLAPNKSLAKARELIANNAFDEAKLFLKVASQSQQMRPWARLLEGQILISNNEIKEGIKKLRSVPATSAASLDARLALLKINATSEHKAAEEARLEMPAIGQELVSLEHELETVNRKDLLAEIEFLKAKLAERQQQYQLSYTIYQQLRDAHANTALGKLARENQAQLILKHKEFFSPESPVFLLAESKALLKEENIDAAQKTLAELKSATAENSKAYLEALLVEEQVLRKLGRKEEADHNLLLVSANGELGTADIALLRIAKNSWNANEHDHALGFIEKLQERFPRSDLRFESEYIGARILEELQAYNDAKSAYLDLLGRTKKLEDRVKVLRRVAWLYFQAGQVSEAAKYFSQIHQEISDSEKASLEPTDNRTKKVIANSALRSEMFHSMYWEAISRLQKADSQEQTATSRNRAPKEIFEKLVQLQPYGYYGMMARNRLPKITMEITRKLKDIPHCFYPVDAELKSKLSAFKNAKLVDYSEYEINWAFRNVNPETSIAQQSPLLNTAAALSVKYVNPRSGFPKVRNALDFITSKENFATDTRARECANYLNQLAHPTPFMQIFKAAAEENNVPIELLLAITRTESAFDSKALSRVKAKGLMQLMTNTAKEEGLEQNQDLFNPETNINLGAKHLAKLLKEFDNSSPKAIAAYNAGRTAVRHWISRHSASENDALQEVGASKDMVVDEKDTVWLELIGYPETKDYVQKVLLALENYKHFLAASGTAS